MNTKFVVAIAVLSAIIGGATGAILSHTTLSYADSKDKVKFGEIEADKITARLVSADVFVSEDEKEGIKCYISKGEIYASKRIIGAHIKGTYIVGGHVLIASNPVATNLNDHKIYIELAAMPETGGVIVIRNKDGVLVLGKGRVETGNATAIGYDRNGSPIMYLHDMKMGDAGMKFIYGSAEKAEKTKSSKTRKDKAKKE